MGFTQIKNLKILLDFQIFILAYSLHYMLFKIQDPHRSPEDPAGIRVLLLANFGLRRPDVAATATKFQGLCDVYYLDFLNSTLGVAWIQEDSRFKIRTEVRTEVLKIRQESWLFYRQIFQDFAAIATKFSKFTLIF